jgi:hypothetical protein
VDEDAVTVQVDVGIDSSSMMNGFDESAERGDSDALALCITHLTPVRGSERAKCLDSVASTLP